ncbi:hydroxypyruvate isomerase family protein [Methylomonas methanica]|uniref:Hydroxypyruvate isomerase n=1 Tax=Methylomonas methanica (strain DSM 25384 / MC09) TaxID=857087 RepID=G0A398_METMM|nr:TIM barrel protein [Methylomonas methanica]AEF99030.1 Hydroxypyruvate isomerase [Methylomonas methanica MC09]
MLRFTANLSMLFTELPLTERFQAAKQHGFNAVEIQFPFDLPAATLQALLQEHDLKLVLFNVDADDLLRGGEGLAAVPEKQEMFRAAVAQACDYAELLQPDCVNVLPGRCLNAGRLAEYRQTFKDNLAYAADVFADIGVTTVFEAINSLDMPGFIVDSSAKMLSVLREVNHPRVRLQYDIYHMSRMREDCAAFLSQHIDKVGHIQFADCPGRGQPGSGAVDFAALFELIEGLAYKGWLGAEYKPIPTTTASLGWIKTRQVTETAAL